MNKKIYIKDNKDYNRLIKKIKIYKSFFYKNKHFSSFSINDFKYLDLIINALNIKNKKDRTIYIYDHICSIIDGEMDLSICGFKNNKCIVQRRSKSLNCNGCCQVCEHQKNGICDTKNLTCKLFYCPTIRKKYNITKRKNIPLFKFFSLRQKLILKIEYFSSREEILNDLNSHFLIITLIRLLNRNKKNWRTYEDKYF